MSLHEGGTTEGPEDAVLTSLTNEVFAFLPRLLGAGDAGCRRQVPRIGELGPALHAEQRRCGCRNERRVRGGTEAAIVAAVQRLFPAAS